MDERDSVMRSGHGFGLGQAMGDMRNHANAATPNDPPYVEMIASKIDYLFGLQGEIELYYNRLALSLLGIPTEHPDAKTTVVAGGGFMSLTLQRLSFLSTNQERLMSQMASLCSQITG